MKKKRLVISGALVLVGLVLNFVFTGQQFLAYALYFAALVCLLFGVIGKKAKRVVCALLALGLVYFIVVETFIAGSASGDPDADYDCIIVLGAAVRGDEPSTALLERMGAARDYLLAHPETTAILSGGQGDGENLSEAEAMYKWLTANGIDGSRLTLEDKSSSTYENLKFSFDILSPRAQGQDISVAVVTSEYHIYRAKLLAASLGYEVGGIPADTGAPAVKLNYFIREAFGVTYQWIFG